MFNKIVGGVLLIIGTSIGASILALPMVTASAGITHSSILLLVSWMFMTLGAFCVLEVTLWLPEGSNLISMAKATLGREGQLLMWIAYLLLLYALLSAFMAGGGDLLENLLSLVNLHFPSSINTLLFTLLFGAIVADGIRSVDWANRSLMSVKLTAFIFLIVLIMPHVKSSNFVNNSWGHLGIAIYPVITSFGYAIVMPSLRTYFKSHVKALRLTTLIGSFIPLVCYLIWDFVVQGSIETLGSQGLASMAQSQHAVGDLTQALSTRLGSHFISSLTHLFTVICITTSFLAVSLSLNDFLTDGLKLKQNFKGKATALSITFLPPLLIVLFYPGAFIKALSYAGLCCVLLLMLLPALMCWSGRYSKKIATGYQLFGGPYLLLLEILVSIALLGYGLFEVFH